MQKRIRKIIAPSFTINKKSNLSVIKTGSDANGITKPNSPILKKDH